MKDILINRILGFLVGIFFFLYYLVPVRIYPLPSSLHVFPMMCAFLLLMYRSNVFYKIPTSLRIFLISFLLSVLLTQNFPKLGSLYPWFFSLLSFLVVANGFRYINKENLMKAMVVIAIIWMSISIGQALIGEKLYFAGWLGAPRVSVYSSGMTIYSNYAAMMFLPLMLTILVLAIFLEKNAYFLLWFFSCISLYFMMSRAAWLGLAVAMVTLFFRIRLDSKRRISFCKTIALLLLATSLAVALPSQVDNIEISNFNSLKKMIVSKIRNVGNSESSNQFDYSTNTRFVTFAVSMKIIKEFPFWGIGVGNYPDFYSKNYKEFSRGIEIDPRSKIPPHNGYLQLITEVGVPSFFALSFFIFLTIRRAYLLASIDVLAINLSVLAILVWLLFHDGLSERLLWILLGLLVAFIKSNEGESCESATCNYHNKSRRC